MARKKTRAEKIQTGYRLQHFRLQVKDIQTQRDATEFGYLSREYVGRDLLKTVTYSLLIIVLLFVARAYLG
jgi:hypothetical protein